MSQFEASLRLTSSLTVLVTETKFEVHVITELENFVKSQFKNVTTGKEVRRATFL